MAAGELTWWKDDFDERYAFLYSEMLSPERTELEVASLMKLGALSEGMRVLDLCCGPGRHTVPLHRRGLRVVGLDFSDVLLRQAVRRAQRVLPDESELPPLVRADARAAPVKPLFDAVVCLFNSIGYGSDQ